MADERIFEQINKLAQEEKDLFKKEEHEGVTDEDRSRLKQLNETLDQCWDLLHQRRAIRSAGGNPRDASVRPIEEVEGYEG
jgi:hypothetical protein